MQRILQGLKNVPEVCPVCGGETVIKEDNGFKFLYCLNKICPAKEIKKYTHFAGRNAMNIDGMSEETLEKFVDSGYIHQFADIYHLKDYEDEIVSTKGFGRKSFDNFIESIDNSRNTEAYRVIFGLGISNIGLTNAKMLCHQYNDDIYALIKSTKDDLVKIDGVGEIIADSFVNYFADENNMEEFNNLLKEINIKKSESVSLANDNITNKTFVITGSLNHYENRDALKNYIESLGGKTTNSVSKKTDYLINNDSLSTSSKNKKGKYNY